ncbi:LuxR C-terminal-related transcriptional regulator [Modestobacter altitudinis]|uniref:LuxR C-terminal-related transcriptional regulator n=1 Tax=Modestobacter altitudinis TaxID=2213158 RepID=UPI00110CE683|nr:LuxR C-terminal-related transcriptional regulator [Modestobacter altitudinis]
MQVPRSKLHRPPPGRSVADRTWLLRRPVPPHDGPDDAPVTLVSAPPGYGKTTLLAGWAGDRAAGGDRVAWVSLDDADDDPVRFRTTLTEALRSAVAAGVVEGPTGGVETGDDVQDALPLVQLEALVSRAGTPVWLLLDDVEAVSAPAVLADIDTLLRRLPDGLHVVLATRRDPAVGLHRLRLAGRLREIRAGDLALARSEVREVLLDHGVTLEEHLLDLLTDRTEGWAAGVRLAALTLSRAADPPSLVQDLGGDEPVIADYLAAEVLHRLTPAEQDLLRLCAVPERLSADLAVAVTGDPTAAVLLERLYRDNTLVDRLVQPSGWYRLHPLLRSHLTAQLRRTAPGLLGAAHARTADWLARRGQVPEALGHAVAAGDDDLAVRLLVAHGPTLLAGGRARQLLRLIGSSPDGVRADGDVRELTTLAEVELGSALPSRIPRPRRSVEDDGASPLQALVQLQRARHGDLALSAAALTASAPATDGRADDLGLLLRLNRGLVWLLTGEFEEAGAELAAAAQLAAATSNDHALLRATAGLSALASSRGDFRRTWLLADETVRVAVRVDALRGAEVAAALLQGAQSAYQRLDGNGARQLAERARSALAGASDAVVETALTTLLGVLDVEDGARPAQATRRLHECWVQSRGQRLPPLLAVYLACTQHRCSWLVGRPDWAKEALHELRVRVGPGGELEVLTATEHLARGRGDAARRRLAPVLDGTVPCLHPLTRQQGWLVEAVLSAQEGQRARCHEALQAALGIADELGALRAFLDMPGVPALLDEDASRFGRLDPLVARIRSAARTRDRSAYAPLTPRELELLTDLPAQLTLEEIAARHQVSLNTVKTHVRSIYLKLGAQSRRQAINSARQRGLL